MRLYSYGALAEDRLNREEFSRLQELAFEGKTVEVKIKSKGRTGYDVKIQNLEKVSVDYCLNWPQMSKVEIEKAYVKIYGLEKATKLKLLANQQ